MPFAHISRPFHFATLAVLYPLLELSLLSAVVLDAALCRIMFAAGFSASIWTTEIFTPGIAWMCKEEYPAIAATNQTSPEMGICF
jgi:hypothetical protein